MSFKYFSIVLLLACGQSYVDALGRIVGGNETTIEARPYQASLQIHIAVFVSHLCGASIISTKHLLTAAHCDPGSDLYLLHARVGSDRYSYGGQVFRVDQFIKHPDYKEETLDNDFAIVTLERFEIILGPTVAIIKLTDDNDPVDGSLVTVSGWGVTSEDSTSGPLILREVDLPVVNADVCGMTYDFLTPRHLCLGGTPEGCLSACFGDSGGPAVQNGIQYALVSGGYSCELPNIPGLYAKISTARSWIANITGV